jgi:cell division transport system permease protein
VARDRDAEPLGSECVITLRPARFDELGLRRARADRLVPFLVACMAFLAALAIAGWIGAAALARHWETGGASTLTIQVPQPGDPAVGGGDETRLNAVLAHLRTAKDVQSARALPAAEVNRLLRSWLGTDTGSLAIPIPGVIAVKLGGDTTDLEALSTGLAKMAPGTVVEDHGVWSARLETLARSLQLCSGLVLLIVTLVTAAVVTVATRASLATRRDEVVIVYQLGATDGYIARRFANRAAVLAVIGGAIGGLFAVPVLFILTMLAMPIGGGTVPTTSLRDALSLLPPLLWALPVILAASAAVVGYVTTQATMRRWLRRLR